jgi:hypothetical protein
VSNLGQGLSTTTEQPGCYQITCLTYCCCCCCRTALFRNSKLTHRLQDALGGNSRLLVLACISPSADTLSGELVGWQFLLLLPGSAFSSNATAGCWCWPASHPVLTHSQVRWWDGTSLFTCYLTHVGVGVGVVLAISSDARGIRERCPAIHRQHLMHSQATHQQAAGAGLHLTMC